MVKVWSKVAIFEKISEIFVEKLGVDKEIIKRESNIIDDLGLNEIDIVDISLGIDTDFSIDVDRQGGEIFNAKTVQDLIKIVDEIVND